MRRQGSGLCGLLTRCASLAAGILLLQASAVSAPRVTSSIIYFPVRGTTPSALYADVLRSAPRGQSGRAMATTQAKITQDATIRRGARCRLESYRLDVKITTRLPRLAENRRISPALRRTWNGFASYVRRHEARHKAIYLRCVRKIEAGARRAFNKAGSCRAAKSALQRMFRRGLARCEALHAGYDRREAGRIKRLPLIVQATRSRRQRARAVRHPRHLPHRNKRRRLMSRR